MPLRLNDFEQQIDPTILKRGHEYFKKGYVTDVADLGHGEYEATVEGSEIYTVSLHIEGDEVTEYECDCPYDWGPVCKHVVAVLFYLQKALLHMDGLPQKKTRSKQNKESETAQFEKLLKILSAEELKSFISNACTQDKSLRRLFVAKHISRLYPESKGLYDRQVEKLIETYSDRYGFIGYHESSRLGNDIYEMLKVAMQEKKRILSYLNRIKPSGKNWDWDYQTAQRLKLQLVRQTEDDTAVTRFMEANVDNSDIRKELIEKAMREKDYGRAEQLTNEGVAKDEKNAPGLVEDWRDYLLQIYQAAHLTEKATTLARHFFVDGRSRHQPREFYYKLLKSLIPQEQWQDYVDNLIADINGKVHRENNYERTSEIYIWEEQWEKLFGLLKKYPNFYRIEMAEKYLAKDHAEELAVMYRNVIIDYMPDNVGRNHYKEVCKYIRRMAKLGYAAMALELTTLLKTQYRNRRALLEELARVF